MSVAASLPPSDQQFIDGLVARIMHAHHLPGAMVYVSGPTGGYTRAYGVADLRRRTPMRTSMHVRIGGITQEFTATAILEQVARGRLSLGSKLSRWVSGIPYGHRITIAELLDMRSGIYDYTTSPAFLRALTLGRSGGGFSTARALATIRAHRPSFAPGQRTRYDNSDYLLLGIILERLTGRSAEAVIEREVAAPAGLRGTGLPIGAGLPSPYAHGYSAALGRSARLRDLTRLDPKLLWTAGAMVSTLGDLARWSRTVVAGTLLPAGLQARRLTSGFATSRTERPTYGMGITRYGEWLGADGAVLGFNTAAFFSPTEEASVVVAVNRSSNTSTRAFEIFSAIARHLYTPAAPVVRTPPQISGTTRSGETLVASPGTWIGTPPPSFSYAWERCDVTGAACRPIPGASGPSYTLGPADVGATLRVVVSARNEAGTAVTGSPVTAVIGLPRDPLIAVDGDIACTPGDTNPAHGCKQAATAALVAAQHADRVFALGDTQYESGLLTEYKGTGAYNDTWGAFNPIVNPVPGNHEYDASPSASGYFTYFGSRAAPPDGSYSFNLGSWHIVALNSNCSDTRTPPCQDELAGETTAAQVAWLKSDLAANRSACVLAMWHHPLFSQGFVGDSPDVRPLWDALYARHADVVLDGHDHMYERYGLLDPNGALSASGIREFVAGTGGESLFAITNPDAHVQFTDNTDYGALMLTLHASSYDWTFKRIGDGAVRDSGSTQCHGPGVLGVSGRSVRAARPVRPEPKLSFDARPHRVALAALRRSGLPIAIHCSRACDVLVRVFARTDGRLRLLASAEETESEITQPYSRLRLRLPWGALSALHAHELVLRFNAIDAASHRRTLVRIVRLS